MGGGFGRQGPPHNGGVRRGGYGPPSRGLGAEPQLKIAILEYQTARLHQWLPSIKSQTLFEN